ncbi:MAG TPA: class I SAM-dependent methyltransferase [Candidatus Angelobacter sp.]|nr:class I SAM-dependent methyltransferase [Candidatus Angelobacter sp.]
MDIEKRPASRTAIGVAVLRAMHELYDDSPKILSDPIIPLFFDIEVLQNAKANLEWYQDPLTTALRSHVVLRSRYAEDSLHEAVISGVHQYVILGAGFDTFAYRQPVWAASLRIFEVDHPASQQAKMERLRQSGISLPPNLEFVSADFESESLRGILLQSSLDFTAPAFFSCLGVLVYLAEDSIREIFQVTASFPKLSQIVFTFSQGNLLSGDERGSRPSLAEGAAAVGEPWRSYHDPDALRRELFEIGFSQISFLLPQQAKDRYYHDRRDGLPPPRRVTIARAVV